MLGISDNNVAVALVNGDDDEEKENLIRMVCRAPGQSSLCIYCPARTHRGYGVCIDYIHCSQKLSQGHHQGGRNCDILASRMGGSGD